MPLPIPDIMQNASDVLVAAKKVTEDQTSGNINELRAALKKVNPDDILAVLNEVGAVYMGMHNMQIQQIGARGNTATGKFEVAIQADFGLGPRTLIVPLLPAAATELVKNFQQELLQLKPGKPVIIGDLNG